MELEVRRQESTDTNVSFKTTLKLCGCLNEPDSLALIGDDFLPESQLRWNHYHCRGWVMTKTDSPFFAESLTGSYRVLIINFLQFLSLMTIKAVENLQPDGSSDNLGYLINVVYRPFIEERVKANHILSRIPCIREFASEIFSISESNSKLAIKALLDHLKDDVEDPGKYQEFKDALKAADYEYIYQALEGQAVINDFEHIKIMGLFSNAIQETIDANMLAQELFSESVINDEMRQRVQTCYQKGSPLDAAFILLDSIHRLKQNWFHIFLKVLYRNGHRNLVKDLDDKYFDELEHQVDHRDTEEQGNTQSENASQLEETRRDGDEDHSSTPSVNTEIDRNQDTNRSSTDGPRIPERLNLAASAEYLTNVPAIVTLTGNMEQLLLLVKRIDAKIDRLEGKVDHLYNTLNIPRP